MALSTDDTISVLNDLIEMCKDGENGFRTASEEVKNPQLKSLFSEYSQQRAQFARELQTEVARIGGEQEKSGSAAGAMHRGWMNVKSAVTGDSDKAIISEAERGEDSARGRYEDALAKGLPPEVRSIVQRQYMRVKECHDRIRSLEIASQSKERTYKSGG